MPKTVFLRNGVRWSVTDEINLDMHDLLPPGNYTIVKHPITGELLFEKSDDFDLPAKLYGPVTARAERILRTYQDRPFNTGVLLSGEKGSGKTQLARVVAHLGYKLGMPCIIINQPWVGDDFNKLLMAVRQPCIVLFDEYEKVYDYDKQKEALTLFDGVFPTKKLFIMTCNDRWLINDHMRNRPGRIYYMLEFRGLDAGFITEYCNDQLHNKDHIPAILKIASMFNEFNFDMLKAMVEELNRYGETPQQVLDMLNARPDTDNEGTYEIAIIIDGEQVPKDRHYPQTYDGSPMHESTMQITFYGTKKEGGSAPDEDDDEPAIATSEPVSKRRPRVGLKVAEANAGHEACTFRLTQKDLKKFDGAKGQFTYVPADHQNVVIRYTRQRYIGANIFDVLA